MIRFIIKRHERDNNSGAEMLDYKTVDIDAPELEKILSGGGSGPMGFESFQLIGAEIIHEPPANGYAVCRCDCGNAYNWPEHASCPECNLASPVPL